MSLSKIDITSGTRANNRLYESIKGLKSLLLLPNHHTGEERIGIKRLDDPNGIALYAVEEYAKVRDDIALTSGLYLIRSFSALLEQITTDIKTRRFNSKPRKINWTALGVYVGIALLIIKAVEIYT